MPETPPERRRRDLRVSYADRERAVEFLRENGGEGRLTTEELADRVGAALSAKTMGDLDDLVADLPPLPSFAPPPPPPPPRPLVNWGVLRVGLVMLFLLSFVGPPGTHLVVLGVWFAALLVVRFAHRADRHRRMQARAAARAAMFPPPPIQSTEWEPPHTDGRY